MLTIEISTCFFLIKSNNIITENNHDEVKEYDLFINFEESIFQEDLIYTSELG